MTEKIILSFMASEKLATDIEKHEKRGGYVSRSDAIRDIVRKGLEKT